MHVVCKCLYVIWRGYRDAPHNFYPSEAFSPLYNKESDPTKIHELILPRAQMARRECFNGGGGERDKLRAGADGQRRLRRRCAGPGGESGHGRHR